MINKVPYLLCSIVATKHVSLSSRNTNINVFTANWNVELYVKKVPKIYPYNMSN